MMKLFCACPESPEILDGGGKDGRRLLGCSLENAERALTPQLAAGNFKRDPHAPGGPVRKGCAALQSGEFHFLSGKNLGQICLKQLEEYRIPNTES